MKWHARVLVATGVLAASCGCNPGLGGISSPEPEPLALGVLFLSSLYVSVLYNSDEENRAIRRARRVHRLSAGQCRFTPSEVVWWSVAGVGGAGLYTQLGVDDEDVLVASMVTFSVGLLGAEITGMVLDRQHAKEKQTRLFIGPAGAGLVYRF